MTIEVTGDGDPAPDTVLIEHRFESIEPGVDYRVEWPTTAYISKQTKLVRFTPRALKDLSKLDRRGSIGFNRWLEALRAGPARAHGQKGWKLLAVSPIREFPEVDTEIKITDSGIRLFGRQISGRMTEFLAASDEH